MEIKRTIKCGPFLQNVALGLANALRIRPHHSLYLHTELYIM